MNRFVFALAQFGPQSLKRTSLAMLLDDEDLPGDGWKVLGQGSWRTGFAARPSDAARRARHARTFTAIRNFHQSGASRWCWIEVIPFVSQSDAEAVLADLPSIFVRNPGIKGTITQERRVSPHDAPEAAAYPFVYEYAVISKYGESFPRMIGGVVDRILFLVSTSEYGAGLAGWSWQEVVDVASLQSVKIERQLRSPA